MDSESERVPPNSVEAEYAVLGTVLLNASNALPLLSELRVDDFFMPEHREAWAAIQAVVERGMPVDVVSVGAEVKARGIGPRFKEGWSKWAFDIVGKVTSVENIEHHARIVQDMARLRGLISLAAEVRSLAYDSQNVEEVISTARDGVAKLEVIGGHDTLVRFAELLAPAMEAIEDRNKGRVIDAVMTGINSLDDLVGGGKRGQVIYVAGRPGDGKSALVKCIARHNGKLGIPFAFFSMEMGDQELIERDLGAESGIPCFAIGRGRLTDKQWSRLQDAAGRLYEGSQWFDTKSRSIGQVMAQARKWHAREVRGQKAKNPSALGGIVVDYIQLCDEETRKGDNREQVVARISRKLKVMAMDLQVPVFAVSQLNRDAEKRGGRPEERDLRESGALEQDADQIWFVYRDVPRENKEARRKSGDGELLVAKHRGGPTGSAKAYWKAETMEWVDRADYAPEPRDTRADLEG